jgi:hypothetical protein
MLDPTYGWSYVNRPWILPALRQTYVAWHASQMQNDFPGVGDFALKRLYELAPDQARPLILEEIRAGEHGIRYDALAILTDASLPCRTAAPVVDAAADRECGQVGAGRASA